MPLNKNMLGKARRRKARLSTILPENELEVILKQIITIKLVNFHALCRADFDDGLLLVKSCDTPPGSNQ